ncbi:uncharacterized protein LOC129747481 [Uranotaenia lowii]|uniref:uncharacterized protein LOC129744434 n=1 Tax=Uranotaenia lowii TaxID=190385 RepID=UPI00247A9EAC|nr:uncharacterized protein LOC129744434 [Uranotaenia lowii]XP_055592923.1 uncharacterized protein LOC129744434 [Uranotaenia lowii]XP_055597698.1 uncharacterized protein LOC129747481 [Uranotaenia lowii]XP_055597699.1 uncharacterized protein LOC129747481 [Uranotaenia lowii]
MDDLFGKKKEVVPILDLSRVTAMTREEFKKMFEKVPDYKMRPIKVRPEEIRFKDKEVNFKMPKKELKMLLKNGGDRDKLYTYMDPIPTEMRNLVIMELCAVSIDWKMLTAQRPKTKVEEDYFSKLVELGKLQIKTEQRDKRENQLSSSVRKVKTKAGIIESRVVTCNECLEEFCNGKVCLDFNYDLYTRVVPKAPLQKTNSQQQMTTSKSLADLNQKSVDSGGSAAESLKKRRRSLRRKSKSVKLKSTDDDDGNQSAGNADGKKKTRKAPRSKSK